MSTSLENFSENPFKCTPSSSSIENQFRMAQVLQRKGDLDMAIKKYIDLCLGVEKTILLNPGADVELQWPVLSLGNISDIYQQKADYNKCLLFRNVQNDFLIFMKNKKQASQSGSDSDGDEGDFFEIATTGHQYQTLFKKMHEAIDTPDTPPRESAQEIARKIMAAKEKEEEEKIEDIIRQLNEATAERERAIQNSFIKRNVRRMTDHPVYFVLVVLFIAFCVVVYVQLKPKLRPKFSGGLDASVAYLQKYMAEYEKKHGITHKHGHKEGDIHTHKNADEYNKHRTGKPKIDEEVQHVLERAKKGEL